MHNTLIIQSFEKALLQEEEIGNSSPSKSRLATILSDYIQEQQGFQFGERRLRDYYNEALLRNPVEIKQPAVLDGLATFLGYDSYVDFVSAFKKKKDILPTNDPEKKGINGFKIKVFLRNHRTSLAIALVSIIVIVFLMASKQQRWMQWNGSNYIETSFDGDMLRRGELKAYREDRIVSFKLLRPQCDTQFFNPDGSTRIWYSKNKDGSLDFFSDYGLHPITGKTLKPITKYIIEKYICKQ